MYMNKLEKMPVRYPINATLELTLRCNLKCKMCMFRHGDEADSRLMKGELSSAQWEDLIKEMFDAGVLNILITGGEPLLRKDFCEIYESMYRRGFIITVYTNATLITEKVMETFRRCPPHRIGITIYGASNETYERLCGSRDGFDRAIEGARALSTLPSEIEFRTTVVKDNRDETKAVSDIIKQEFDLPVTHSTTVFQGVRGGCMPIAECRLSPEENVDLLVERTLERVRELFPPERRDQIGLKPIDAKQYCASEKNKFTLLGCQGGMNSFTITWDGKLLGCQMLDCFSTDAVKNGFLKAWEEWPNTVHLPEVDPTCTACPYITFCQVCPAVRMAECGNLSGRPEYVCQITKALLSDRRGKNEKDLQKS